MSKISCDVTKDLLPVYLDDVCSQESKTLVEEHLQECLECKHFLEQLKIQDITYNQTDETALFLKKARRYLDHRNNIIFFITLLFASLLTVYSEINYNYVPDIMVYVALPVLMCTFFLTRPKEMAEEKTEKKWRFLPFVSVGLGLFLMAFHLFFVEQLTLLFTSSNQDRVFPIFRVEPAQLGPFVEKIYLFCIFAEILSLIIYYLFGNRKRNLFILGQNAAWLGLGLGIMYRETLFRMDTLESFRQISITMTGILFVEFIVLLGVNLMYIKRKG